MHSISIASPDVRITPQKVSGEKVIVKALVAIVNREGKKKIPLKKIHIPSSESA
jgi:hypothetical protein